MPGSSPAFIIKPASSPPQVIDLSESTAKSLTQLHTPECQKGFLYVDGEVFVNKWVKEMHAEYDRAKPVQHSFHCRANTRQVGSPEGYSLVKKSTRSATTKQKMLMSSVQVLSLASNCQKTNFIVNGVWRVRYHCIYIQITISTHHPRNHIPPSSRTGRHKTAR